MNKIGLVATLLISFSGAAHAGCLENLSERANRDVVRYKELHWRNMITKLEYNDLIGGASAVVQMGALMCQNAGDADFSQEQVDQLVLSVLENKLQ